MIVALDTSPTSNKMHQVRGVGAYIRELESGLKNSSNLTLRTISNQKEAVGADLLHIPYFDPFQITLPKNNAQKLVVTIHDLIPLRFPEHFPSGIKGKLKWHFQQARLKNINAVITDSQASKADIIKYTGLSSDKIHVIYLAAGQEFRVLSSTHAVQSIRNKFNLPEKFVLYVGDVTWNKNLPNLIRASIEERIPLIIVGKAITNKNYERTNIWNKDLETSQELIPKNHSIITPGYVTQDELVSLYNLATITALPSRYEGFGLPVLEAMQCGCPVITTKNGSLPEVAGSSALYITGTDKESIAVGIMKLFNDTKLQKELSKKGIDNAKRFSWDKTVSETAEVYKGLIASD